MLGIDYPKSIQVSGIEDLRASEGGGRPLDSHSGHADISMPVLDTAAHAPDGPGAAAS
jgi:hypothetical protein